MNRTREATMAHVEKNRRPSGCLVGVGMGCLVIVIVLVISLVGGYFVVKNNLRGWVEKYSDSQPAEMPERHYPSAQVAAVRQRIADFAAAVQRGQAVRPLILNADDINGLLADHVGRYVHIGIENGRIGGQVSLPLGLFLNALEGRYLNGQATFNVAVVSGRLVIYIDRLSIAGKALPSHIMQAMKAKNLADESNQNVEVAAFFENIESLRIEADRLILLPRRVGTSV